jgi:Holliday junction resolvasome RuvABC endonuclease subunit|nr:MAG TPA: RuvC [Bacteriophage sp.]
MENQESDKVTREQVLGLDIATHTGFYSVHESGTWNFTESKRRNGNKMHGAFRVMLLSFIRRYGIRRIVAEDVSVNRHFYDMRRLAELRGILLEVCDTFNLAEPEFVNPATLKKFATGDGRADKAAMIRACREKYRYEPVDDNAADACHLYHYYLRKYRI